MKKLDKKLNNDLKGLFSLSRKAGYTVIGLENLLKYEKRLYLLIVDESAGKSLMREMNFLSNKRQIPLAVLPEVEKMIGIQNCKAIGIKNKKFTELISDKIQEKNNKGE